MQASIPATCLAPGVPFKNVSTPNRYDQQLSRLVFVILTQDKEDKVI